MNSEELTQYHENAASDVRKLTKGKGLVGTFAIALGREHSLLVFNRIQVDKKASKAKTKAKTIKGLVNARKFSYGRVHMVEGRLCFEVIQGPLKGNELLKALRMNFNSAPAPLPVLLKQSRLYSVSEEGEVRSVGSTEEFNPVDPVAYKRELKSSIDNDPTLSPAKKEAVIRDLKSLFETLDQQATELAEARTELDDLEITPIEVEEPDIDDVLRDVDTYLERNRPAPTTSPGALRDLERTSEIQASVEREARDAEVESSFLHEAPSVGDTVGDLGDLAMLVNVEHTRHLEDQSLANAFPTKVQALYTELILAYDGQLRVLEADFKSKDEHFNAIYDYVEKQMFKPHIDKIVGDQARITDPKDQAIIKKGIANLDELYQMIRSDFRLNTIDRRVAGVTFFDSMSPKISALKDYLELSERLSIDTE